MDFTADSPIVIRMAFFACAFGAFATLEAYLPRRVRRLTRAQRWPTNIGLSVLNQLLARILVPLTAVGAAVYAQEQHYGLLNLLNLPDWLELVLAVLILDLAIYWQHRLYHVIPLLWRIHLPHHADTDFDVTTGIRFHPLSILISALIKLAMVLVIGVSPLAVICFEILLNATSMFNHSNIRLAISFDRILRQITVTPDMHRVHHSSNLVETNSNFGFNFPWWDHLFGTYSAQPKANHETMEIGLPIFRGRAEAQLTRTLSQPWRKNTE